MSKFVVIMRGLPGSGKSTLARSIMSLKKQENVVYLSTDHIWEHGPHYLWVPEFLGAAHKMTQAKFELACKREIPNIIIDNTNTCWKEIEPYAVIANKYDYHVSFMEPDTDWRFNVQELYKKNSHNVPLEVIEKMLARWESEDSVAQKLQNLYA